MTQPILGKVCQNLPRKSTVGESVHNLEIIEDDAGATLVSTLLVDNHIFLQLRDRNLGAPSGV